MTKAPYELVTLGLLFHQRKDYSMAIYKAKVHSEFAQIPNATAQDSRLSFEARGLLVMMLSMPDTWVIHKEWLIKQSPKCGRDKMTRLLKELIDFGYMIKKAKHEKGQLNGVDWLVHAEPHSEELKNRRTEYLSDCKSNTIKETSLERNINTKKQDNLTIGEEYLSEDELPKNLHLCREGMNVMRKLDSVYSNIYLGKQKLSQWKECESALNEISYDIEESMFRVYEEKKLYRRDKLIGMPFILMINSDTDMCELIK